MSGCSIERIGVDELVIPVLAVGIFLLAPAHVIEYFTEQRNMMLEDVVIGSIRHLVRNVRVNV